MSDIIVCLIPLQHQGRADQSMHVGLEERQLMLEEMFMWSISWYLKPESSARLCPKRRRWYAMYKGEMLAGSVRRAAVLKITKFRPV
jgi:hypothetical protein